MPSVWLILINCQMTFFFQFRITGYHWFKPGKGSTGDIVLYYLAGYFLTSRSLWQSALVYLKCISSYFLYWSASRQANWRFHGFKTYEIIHLPPYWAFYFVELTLLFLYQVPLLEILSHLFLFLFSLRRFTRVHFLHVYICVHDFSL